jgi:signal peptidase I
MRAIDCQLTAAATFGGSAHRVTSTGMTQDSRLAAPKSSDQKATPENTTNIKETIESILVAFILAFIFRAFVLEAFIIPTGSMAPTLLGAHLRFRCPDCGYQFDVNYSPPRNSDSDDPPIPAEGEAPTDVYCPNCGYHVLAAPTRTSPQPVQYGDKILVLKYVYLLHPPRRWDVVVFKSPDHPEETHYTQNFIKRLVGLPGERLMVLDGDIFISNQANPNWQIQVKPRDVQEALWRLVYDNDYFPQHVKREGQPDWVQPWRPVSGSGWDQGHDATTGRAFKFSNSSGSGELQFDPNANSTTQTLTDYLVYDLTREYHRFPSAAGSPDDEGAIAVSDLKLVVNYQRISGDGPLRLKLSRQESVPHTFTAEFNADTIRLLHATNAGESQIGPTLRLSDLGIKPADPIFIEFLNVDYRVTLRVNGKDAIVSTPQDYHPNIDWLMQQFNNQRHGKPGSAVIEAGGQTCSLNHISLWRDVYYTNRLPPSQGSRAVNSGSPRSPAELGSGEYFVMGDNSAISEDARYWTDKIDLPHEGLDVQSGRVPEQFMLGQAVFVYWPAGFRLFDSHFAIIPNFGDMRWIH